MIAGEIVTKSSYHIKDRYEDLEMNLQLAALETLLCAGLSLQQIPLDYSLILYMIRTFPV